MKREKENTHTPFIPPKQNREYLPPKEIYPYICVYTDLVEDPTELYNIAKDVANSENNLIFDILPWSIFGKISVSNLSSGIYTPFTSSNSNDPNLLNEIKLFETLMNCSEYAITDYISRYNIQLPPKSYLSHQAPHVNVAEYKLESDLEAQENKERKSMDWHTDFMTQSESSEDNYFITCNIYINDDYIGGELGFKIGEDVIKYKPNAGETIVFPSGAPNFPVGKKYLHEAFTPEKTNKYFSRNYVLYPDWK
jgi:hypothetical protein